MATPSKRRAGESSPAAAQLFCLPFAGGGTAAFYGWRSAFPPAIELLPLTLPGREARINERPFTELQPQVVALAEELPATWDAPFALLGHSMGGWLAFELARELRRRGARAPELLIVSACRAPHIPLTHAPIHTLPDAELLDEVDRRYHGVPREVRAMPELLQLMLPTLRADLRMVETYHFVEEPPLEIEILVMGGTEDAAVSPAQLAGWQRHTTRVCSLRQFPGGHFFLFGGAEINNPLTSTAQTRAQTPALSWLAEWITRRFAGKLPEAHSEEG